MAEWIALVIGILGVAGVVFTALRFNRSDATEAINQQSRILNDMHVLNDELRITNAELKTQVSELREQIERLRDELRNAGLTGP